MLHFYENMHPRRRSAPAAAPCSAKKAVAQWNGADMGLGTVLTLEMVE